MKHRIAVLGMALLLAGCRHVPLTPVTMAPHFSCVIMNESPQDLDVQISYNQLAPRWEPLHIPAGNEQEFDRPVRIRIASPSNGGGLSWDDHVLEMGKRYAIVWDRSIWRVVEPTPG
jgi:hypothetical protein